MFSLKIFVFNVNLKFSNVFSFVSDVERAVGGSHVSDGDEDDVDQGPDTEASEAEQFADAFLPVTEIKPENVFWQKLIL